MPETVGGVQYELGVDMRKLRTGFTEADAAARRSGSTVESAFGKQAAGGIAAAGKQADGLGAKLRRMAGAGGFQSALLGGVGLGAGLFAFQSITRAIGGVTDAIGDSIAAGQAEEASMGRLYTALEANAKGWDGNRESVEDWLTANMRATAFADDEQRTALISLVGATKDLTEAQDLLSIAMDLSRAKQISLKTAADIITRVYAGNLGTLSRYGIIVEKGATATEALAAIQRLAAGQAAEYGDKSEAAAVKAEQAWGEASEAIGMKLMGAKRVFDDFSRAVAESVLDAVDRIGDLGGAISDVIHEIEDFGSGIDRESTELAILAEQYGVSTDAIVAMIIATRQQQKEADAIRARFELQRQALAAGAGDFDDWTNAEMRAALAAAGLSEEIAEQIEVMGEAELAAQRLVKEDQERARFAAKLAEHIHLVTEATGEQASETRSLGDQMREMFGDAAEPIVALAARYEGFGDAIESVAGSSFPELRDAAKEAQKAIHAAFAEERKPLDLLEREMAKLDKQRARALRDRRFGVAAIIDDRRAEVQQQVDDHRKVNRLYRAEAEYQRDRRRDIRRVADEHGTTTARIRRMLLRHEGDLQSVIDKLNEVDGTKVDPDITVDTSQANTVLDNLQARLANIESDPVYISIYERGGRAGSGGGGGAVTTHRAVGGPVLAGQLYGVNERGLESYFRPNGAGHVLTARQTDFVLNAGAAALAGRADGCTRGNTTTNHATTINLSVQGQPVRAETPVDIVRQLRRGARMGYLQPRRKVAWA